MLCNVPIVPVLRGIFKLKEKLCKPILLRRGLFKPDGYTAETLWPTCNQQPLPLWLFRRSDVRVWMNREWTVTVCQNEGRGAVCF